MEKRDVDLSVVIPLLNEEGSLIPLYEKLTSVLKGLNRVYELIFVDDGSTDGSSDILDRLAEEDGEHCRLIQFRRNFGKAAALSAGFHYASGNIIITTDADMQDEPEEIPRFLAKLDEGYDLVSGWKEKRKDSFLKKLSSRIFNAVTKFFSKVNIRDFNCGFKAYRRDVINQIKVYGELHRYIPVLAHGKGFQIAEIPVEHHERKSGKSKYNWKRFLRGFFDFLTVHFLNAYLNRPLHLFGGFGLLSFVAGFIINCYLAVLWFMGYRPIGNRPLFMLGILLLIIGVQLIVFGLLGEMLNNMMHQRENIYSIKAMKGFQDNTKK